MFWGVSYWREVFTNLRCFEKEGRSAMETRTHASHQCTSQAETDWDSMGKPHPDLKWSAVFPEKSFPLSVGVLTSVGQTIQEYTRPFLMHSACVCNIIY